MLQFGTKKFSTCVAGERIAVLQGRGDVASLVRNLLGPIYGDGVINLLIRQARDILVCAYHGNLENFLKTYLSPAASLLAEVKSAASETSHEASSARSDNSGLTDPVKRSLERKRVLNRVYSSFFIPPKELKSEEIP
ncbi:hypothetical protein K0M31_010225 [Melipona bicolor]|uniref:Uncharacterized protein n=1 Tax=Melipona bicolor TaxID=60889 RepID=A0AA40FME0_9HYME|nr:hypothetical protein K0M31_010225 [Melipona bicolor]